MSLLTLLKGVTSNASGMGTNVKVRIDDRTGAVLEQSFLPR